MSVQIATPFDVAKIRLQTDLATGTMRYNGMFDVMKSIGGSDGLRALFAGCMCFTCLAAKLILFTNFILSTLLDSCGVLIAAQGARQ